MLFPCATRDQRSPVRVDTARSGVQYQPEKLVNLYRRIDALARLDKHVEAVDLRFGGESAPVQLQHERLVHGAEPDRHIRQEVEREFVALFCQAADFLLAEKHRGTLVHRLGPGGARHPVHHRELAEEISLMQDPE
jgi:hypothetical protein